MAAEEPALAGRLLLWQAGDSYILARLAGRMVAGNTCRTGSLVWVGTQRNFRESRFDCGVHAGRIISAGCAVKSTMRNGQGDP